MLIVKLAILGQVFCPQKMVTSTAFATRLGWSVSPEMHWSVSPEMGGQLAPEWCGLIHQNLHISFYWSGDGCLADTLFEAVNCNFQEIPYMDEPMHLQKFDRLPENDSPDFDFEDRLLEQVWNFCKLLNDHDDEECEPNI